MTENVVDKANKYLEYALGLSSTYPMPTERLHYYLLAVAEQVKSGGSGSGGGSGYNDIYTETAISMNRATGTTVGMYSIAFGMNVEASGRYACAIGQSCKASGNWSNAEGQGTTASGYYSHAQNYMSEAVGDYSNANGCFTKALGQSSHTEGYYTIANDYNYVLGHHNDDSLCIAGADNNTTGTALCVGNGKSQTSKSNAFRVDYDGSVYGQSAYSASGADYAEYFEWLDSNPDNEDRVGYFVTLDGNKIKIANEGDYILGVVSANPLVIGNNDMQWQGKFKKDEFGRFILEDRAYVINPDYDETQEYIFRKDRAEWSTVGLLGQLVVYDDGTCEVNSYCKCSSNGIATKSDNGYRVIERINDNLIKILYK